MTSTPSHPTTLCISRVAAIPIRQILDAGLVAGGGSDAPVAPPSPLLSLGWMVTRETLRGDVLGPEQGITPREALHLYTLGSAHTQFAEGVLGTIEAGKLADLVVLDRNPFTVEPRSIRDIQVEMTIVDGRIVHE
jgi:predicted amidohydrolase YtcJ